MRTDSENPLNVLLEAYQILIVNQKNTRLPLRDFPAQSAPSLEKNIVILSILLESLPLLEFTDFFSNPFPID